MVEEREETNIEVLKDILKVMTEMSSKSDDLYREMREIKVRLSDMNK
jgi:hypothetical protein